MSYPRAQLGDVPAGMPDGEGGIRPFTRAELERMQWDPMFLETPQQNATAEEIHAYEVDRGTEGLALPGFTATSIATTEGKKAYDAALAAERLKYAGTAARVDAAWRERVDANTVVTQARGAADTAAEAESNRRAIEAANAGGGTPGHVLKTDEKPMMELQVSDAVPLSDGSLTTNLVDRYGMTVATVTRLADGSAMADVSDSSAGFDIAGMLKKATVFLDGVAKTAQGIKTEITRVENAGKAAAVGYRAPTTATPYLVAGGVLVGLLMLYSASSRPRR